MPSHSFYLQQDEASRLKTILEGTGAGTWEWNVQTGETRFNARWAEVTGAKPPRSVEDWRPHIHPDEFDRTIEKFEFATRRKLVFSDEWRLRLADGSYRWALSRAVPIQLADGSWRWVGTIIDIDDAHRLSESRDLLARELSHRIKNIFAVMSSLITLSARRDPLLRQFAQDMTDKIAALGRAHEFVAPTGLNDEKSLHGLLAKIFAPYSDGDSPRVDVFGDDPAVNARSATPLALVFHELATNSAKYGVLSLEEGTVEVEISLVENEMVRLVWKESGVSRHGEEGDGFGSRLLRMSVEGQLQGSIDRQWSEEGLSVILNLSLPVLAA